MLYFLAIILLFSILLNILFIVQLLALEKTNKLTQSEIVLSKANNETVASLVVNKQKVVLNEVNTKNRNTAVKEKKVSVQSTFAESALPFVFPASFGDTTAISLDYFSKNNVSSTFVTVQNEEILKLPKEFLVHYLNNSMEGQLTLSYNQLQNVNFNLVLLDLESNASQFMVGLFFSSLNTYVQLVIDKDCSSEVQLYYMEALYTFFGRFGFLSLEVENKFKTLFTNSVLPVDLSNTPSFVFPALVGYNLNNFDLPVLDCFMSVNVVDRNPVEEARLLVNRLLTGKDKQDFKLFSVLLKNVLVVDIFWQTGGRLKEWIRPLNNSGLFTELKPKSWDNSKFARVSGSKLYDWLVYNRNDLLATYFLCLYQNHFVNFVLPRFNLFLLEKETETLASCLRTRYLNKR